MALTQVQSGMLNSDSQNYGFKNRIINGDMRIDQRNAGAAVTVDGANLYGVDRWTSTEIGNGALSQQQISDAPPGFKNSLRITTTTAQTGTLNAVTRQYIEGTNLIDLAWGTASAKAISLSFWVKSSLTGTFGGSLKNDDNSRNYVFSYTISSANTWEYKTVSVPGDTSGTWPTTTGIGMTVWFSHGASNNLGSAGSWTGTDIRGVTGQTNIIATLNATWQITGVQLELGATATQFDYRPFGTELALCQRYFQKIAGNTSSGYENFATAVAYSSGSSAFRFQIYLPVVMRTAPSFAQVGNFVLLGVVSGSVSGMSLADSGGNPIVGMGFTSPSAGSAGQVSVLRGNNDTTAAMLFSAEL